MTLLSQLLDNEDHLITKIYEECLKLDTEREIIKEFMINWARNIGHNIQLEDWQRTWEKGLKFSASHYMKEIFYKMHYRWYLTHSRISKMKNLKDNKCWKCNKDLGTFFHQWWLCEKAKLFWVIIHEEISKKNWGQRLALNQKFISSVF